MTHILSPEKKQKLLNSQIIEVKPLYLLKDPQCMAKFDAAHKLYGDKFVIVTEYELRELEYGKTQQN